MRSGKLVLDLCSQREGVVKARAQAEGLFDVVLGQGAVAFVKARESQMVVRQGWFNAIGNGPDRDRSSSESSGGNQ